MTGGRTIFEHVLSRAASESGAVGIRIGGLPEPLCTMMRVAVWQPIVAARITTQRLKASSLLTDARGSVTTGRSLR